MPLPGPSAEASTLPCCWSGRRRGGLGGLAQPLRLLSPANHVHVGFGGAFLTKIGGMHHLLGAEFGNEAGESVNVAWNAPRQAHDYSGLRGVLPRPVRSLCSALPGLPRRVQGAGQPGMPSRRAAARLPQ